VDVPCSRVAGRGDPDVWRPGEPVEPNAASAVLPGSRLLGAAVRFLGAWREPRRARHLRLPGEPGRPGDARSCPSRASRPARGRPRDLSRRRGDRPADPPLDLDALILESVYPSIEEATRERLWIRLGPLGPPLSPLLLAQLKRRLGIASPALRRIDRIGQVRTVLQCFYSQSLGFMAEHFGQERRIRDSAEILSHEDSFRGSEV
jgi:hypothetical protein